MYKLFTYLLVTYFPTYLPIYETYFLQNWLSRWNQILTQLDEQCWMIMMLMRLMNKDKMLGDEATILLDEQFWMMMMMLMRLMSKDKMLGDEATNLVG